ncbi:Uncharacterised protein [Yersinia aldovae]|uniref:Uncharacterized protein n=1 Tax=Yersinia aldovae TaxID=29483 RepID=A0A0T9USB9_YERAL|nr:hypothetical protein AT01_2146 [Yersinia aldovae 670-83]CNK25180.1 Uncharacterised protein [Yersinia aldovae]CNL63658.1 Uncharacterised protein [Yersinia aldovae]CNL66350.1 Uncharacterised protein [Yersinia aldovae]
MLFREIIPIARKEISITGLQDTIKVFVSLSLSLEERRYEKYQS